jgi:hypothetical protein
MAVGQFTGKGITIIEEDTGTASGMDIMPMNGVINTITGVEDVSYGQDISLTAHLGVAMGCTSGTVVRKT